MRNFTELQGQYLRFIHFYTVIHRRPPAEADLREFFLMTAPTVHNMVLALQSLGLIDRVPGAARSIRVLVPREDLPLLDAGPTSDTNAT